MLIMPIMDGTKSWQWRATQDEAGEVDRQEPAHEVARLLCTWTF
jgi:hypothetical protein